MPLKDNYAANERLDHNHWNAAATQLNNSIAFEEAATRAAISNRTDARQIHVLSDENEDGAETWLFYNNGTLKLLAYLV